MRLGQDNECLGHGKQAIIHIFKLLMQLIMIINNCPASGLPVSSPASFLYISCQNCLRCSSDPTKSLLTALPWLPMTLSLVSAALQDLPHWPLLDSSHREMCGVLCAPQALLSLSAFAQAVPSAWNAIFPRVLWDVPIAFCREALWPPVHRLKTGILLSDPSHAGSVHLSPCLGCESS